MQKDNASDWKAAHYALLLFASEGLLALVAEETVVDVVDEYKSTNPNRLRRECPHRILVRLGKTQGKLTREKRAFAMKTLYSIAKELSK